MSDLNISKDQRKHISHTTIGEIVNVRQNVNAYEWMKGDYVCFVCASVFIVFTGASYSFEML